MFESAAAKNTFVQLITVILGGVVVKNAHIKGIVQRILRQVNHVNWRPARFSF